MAWKGTDFVDRFHQISISLRFAPRSFPTLSHWFRLRMWWRCAHFSPKSFSSAFTWPIEITRRDFGGSPRVILYDTVTRPMQIRRCSGWWMVGCKGYAPQLQRANSCKIVRFTYIYIDLKWFKLTILQLWEHVGARLSDSARLFTCHYQPRADIGRRLVQSEAGEAAWSCVLPQLPQLPQYRLLPE